MKRVTLILRLTALCLTLAAVFSDFLSPSPPEALDLNQFFAPPSRIHFVDAQGKFHLRPFCYPLELTDPQQARYHERTNEPCPLEFFSPGYPYRLFGIFPASRHLAACRTAGVLHPWGTDDLGRDVMSRTLAGARTSLLVLLFGWLAYLPAGVAVGACAGLLKGWVDSALMRFSEFVLALPALYLVLAIQSLLPPHTPYWLTAWFAAATIAAVTWPPLARGVRGLIHQIHGNPCVEAARTLGASPPQIFRQHVLPAVSPFVLAQLAIAAPAFILGEVILSFLNVGFHGAGVSWGAMLRGIMQHPRELTEFWWNMLPLGFVFVTLFCLSSMAGSARLRGPRQLT